MFHADKIAAAVAAIEAAQAIKLVEHSVAESVAAYDFFSSLAQTDGKRVWYARPGQDPEAFQFTPEEQQWIRNEMFMCSVSFPYFFYRYFFIKTKEGHIARPDVLYAQQIYLAVLADLDLRELPMLLLILKARQLGLSTITEAVILWIALFRRGCHTVIASAEEEKSVEMSNMVWTGIEYLPLWMRPRITREDRRLGPEFGDNESDILLQHGAMSKGISRGSTPIAAHLSEVAYYPDPIETIESSLIRAMHENPRTFLALETTARRKGDWFHRTWLANREGEATGYNRFTCLFLPWYVGRDKYPTEGWLRNHPIPPTWNPRTETVKQQRDAELYVATTSLLTRYLGSGWTMPREQQWFWEFNYVEAAREDETLKSFNAEMASDERSAFQSKRWSVYTVETLDKVEKGVEAAHYVDYALVGDGIGPEYSLRDYWSPSKQRIDIHYLSIREQNRAWKLIPLRVTPTEDQFQYYVRIWELPKPGYRYTIGADLASGVGKDRTCIEILRIGRDPTEPDIQVGQIYSPWISAIQAPPYCLALGAYYGQHMSPVPEALLAPETQVSVGDLVSSQLATDGYSNFHYMERYDMRKTPGHKSRRRGWASNAWSIPLRDQTLKHAVDNGWLIVNSEHTLHELQENEAEEMDSGKVKFDHASGEHDDSLVALGIAEFVSHDEETIADRMKGNLKPRKPNEPRVAPQTPQDSTEAMLARHFQREEGDDVGVWEQGRLVRQAREDGENEWEGQYVY